MAGQIWYSSLRLATLDHMDVQVEMDRNWAMICPVCGDIWGRVGTGKPGNHWLPLLRGCKADHARDSMDQPGSLLIDKEFFRPWPAPRTLLLRELVLAEKGEGVAYPAVSRYNPITTSLELHMTPELANRIAQLRDKTLKGTITDQELKDGLAALREGRQFSAAKAGAAKRSERTANAAPINTDELLKSFF